MHSAPQIVRAAAEHLDLVAPLFDAYRQFYGKTPDLAGASQFLAERIENQQSVIFLALDGNRGAGFVQVYPSFSSVSLRPLWVLNDLFVAEDARRQGLGERLLIAARDFAVHTRSVRLVLATAIENVTAQSLYKRLGWQRDTTFFHYNLEL